MISMLNYLPYQVTHGFINFNVRGYFCNYSNFNHLEAVLIIAGRVLANPLVNVFQLDIYFVKKPIKCLGFFVVPFGPSPNWLS